MWLIEKPCAEERAVRLRVEQEILHLDYAHGQQEVAFLRAWAEGASKYRDRQHFELDKPVSMEREGRLRFERLAEEEREARLRVLETMSRRQRTVLLGV